MQLKKVDCFEGTRFYVFSRSSRRLSAGYCTSDSVLSHSSGGDPFQDLFLWTSISFPLAIIQIKVGKGNVAYSEELCWEELLTQSLNLHAGGFEDLHFHPLIMGWHNY